MNIDHRVRLRDQLHTAFSAAELAALCTRLGIPYAQLRERSLRDKVGSLIGSVNRRGLMQELVRERPHLRAHYASFLPARHQPVGWLERWAAGEGELIEEPPTLRWYNDADPPAAS